MQGVWNHNSHYHELLLAVVPDDASRVLDVGCGFGLFAARLAKPCRHVDAIDIDEVAIELAKQSYGSCPGLRYWSSDFVAADFPDETYDALTCVAGLHHMPFSASLLKMARILKPGGTLAILGLYRNASFCDYAAAAVATPVSLVLASSNTFRKAARMAPQLRSPEMSLVDIRTDAKALLPGVQFKRLLFWRYLLVWQKNPK